MLALADNLVRSSYWDPGLSAPLAGALTFALACRYRQAPIHWVAAN
jgi:hypothetical protein